MKEFDKNWIAESVESGNKYGFPKCCIDEFFSSSYYCASYEARKALRFSVGYMKRAIIKH